MKAKPDTNWPDSDDVLDADAARDQHGFGQTQWSEVVRPASSADEQLRRQALEKLYLQYFEPLKAFLLAGFAWKYQVGEDWVDVCMSEFVEKKLLDPDFIRKGDPARGQFRHFLKKSLLNFAKDQFRKSPPATPSSDEPDSREVASPHSESAGDVQWARKILEQVLRRMKAECELKGQNVMWTIFERRRLGTLLNGAQIESLEDTARFVERDLGIHVSINTVSNHQTSSDRKFARIIRDVLSDYCRSKEAIEDELQEFIQLLRAGLQESDGSVETWSPTI